LFFIFFSLSGKRVFFLRFFALFSFFSHCWELVGEDM